MDLTLTDTGGASDLVWLTGRVREPDGLGYDVETISYIVFPLSPPLTPAPKEVLWLDLPTTSEKGVALDANGFDVYVAATIQPGGVNDAPLILTFKIDEDSGAYAFDWSRLFGYLISDIPAAIIAPTRNDTSVSVFVFGQSFFLSNSYDQVGVHYTQNP